jgi:hypothetical protein
MSNLRYREKNIQDIPSSIEELIPFLTKTHAEILQKGATQIRYCIGNERDCRDDNRGVLEISYYTEETAEEKAANERWKRSAEQREKEQYEKLRLKFEKDSKK